ncbi:hypothetical protein GUJ93_ZPchr0013g36982 [Zizania palustris]|uniref:Uncharacterized protein n=1 Tax=Zizania palustris TaxID=103762 RepID=A0A8J6C2Y6_ZIZPA|nr:hypothetical protein GUJ93_ZPchr0013g36982 [Zizania palustris]
MLLPVLSDGLYCNLFLQQFDQLFSKFLTCRKSNRAAVVAVHRSKTSDFQQEFSSVLISIDLEKEAGSESETNSLLVLFFSCGS